MKLLYFILAFYSFSFCQNRATIKARSIDEAIIDKSNLLKAKEKSSLFLMINMIEGSFGSRLAIVIADSLYGKSVDDYAFEIIESMQLGPKKDGLLVVLAPKEKVSRIEVAYGLERIITDEIAARIIKSQMTPHFKKKEYFDGLLGALKEIQQNIESKQHLIGKSLKDN